MEIKNIEELLNEWQKVIDVLDRYEGRKDKSLALGYNPDNFNTNNLNILLFVAIMKDCSKFFKKCLNEEIRKVIADFLNKNFQCYYDYVNKNYDYTEALAMIFVTEDIENSKNRVVMLKSPPQLSENKFQFQKFMSTKDISNFLDTSKFNSILGNSTF